MLGTPDVNPPTPPFGRDLASSSLKTSSNVPITPALPNPPERRILERVREPGRCPGVHPDRLLALCLGAWAPGLPSVQLSISLMMGVSGRALGMASPARPAAR